MKRSKGFTLVELVIVIAIIGVLAALLVPSIINYIRKSRLKAANTNAKTAYNAVAEFVTERAANDGDSLNTVISTYGNQPIDCSETPAVPLVPSQQAVYDMLSQNGINSGVVWVGEAEIADTDSFFVQWTNEDDPVHTPHPVFGQYPNPISWDCYTDNDPAWAVFNDANGPVDTSPNT